MDSFLKHYPYCYGYWKKYADIVKKHHGFDEVEKIFERGVEAIPLSIDLWIHYLEWTIKQRFKDKNENNDEHIRKLFNRALEVCGMEFKSDRLWQMALDWESQKRNSHNVFALYEKLITIPTQSYSNHYTSITEIVQSTDPLEILEAEELRKLKLQIQKERKEAAEAAKAAQPNEDAVIAATLIPDTAADALGKSTDAITDPHDLPLSEEEEQKLLKEKILASREIIHKKTAEEVTKRWQFEEAVKRPYFHVKPLEKSQLKNWREYLDFEIKEGSKKRIALLFERCLIACALYEEFWIKYARYTYDSLKNINEARNIFRRGCIVHLPMKVNLVLEWAEFEEKVSGFDEALSILDEYEKRYPGIIAVKVHRLGILRRSGNLDSCENILEETLKSVSNATVKAFWAHKYARFCLKVLQNSSKAKEILTEVVKEQPSNAKLAMHLVDVLYTDNDIDGMLNVLEECTQRENLTAEERIAFSQCRLDFLDDLACDVKLVVAAKLAHENLHFEIKEKKQKRKAESIEGGGGGGAAAAAAAAAATYTGGDGAGAKRTKVDQDWYQQFQQPSGSGDYSSQQFYQQQWANYYSGNWQQ
ncbi:DgyrCDS722 [Dimorphilus gyrociliatus]|uniref:DgyrCDS722 n=1 Tax=Dimorphilus gyrociliatus TaxID=2664684 RepID=A0A7I8VA15_9ANNE|nr:DgyrCDS722 [Dimorphilus gyrociliatus]